MCEAASRVTDEGVGGTGDGSEGEARGHHPPTPVPAQ